MNRFGWHFTVLAGPWISWRSGQAKFTPTNLTWRDHAWHRHDPTMTAFIFKEGTAVKRWILPSNWETTYLGCWYPVPSPHASADKSLPSSFARFISKVAPTLTVSARSTHKLTTFTVFCCTQTHFEHKIPRAVHLEPRTRLARPSDLRWTQVWSQSRQNSRIQNRTGQSLTVGQLESPSKTSHMWQVLYACVTKIWRNFCFSETRGPAALDPPGPQNVRRIAVSIKWFLIALWQSNHTCLLGKRRHTLKAICRRQTIRSKSENTSWRKKAKAWFGPKMCD